MSSRTVRFPMWRCILVALKFALMIQFLIDVTMKCLCLGIRDMSKRRLQHLESRQSHPHLEVQ